MKRLSLRLWFAVGLSIVLVLTFAIFIYGTSASQARIEIFTPHGLAPCATIDAPAPAIFQTQTLLARFDYYRVLAPPFGPEPVEVDITFPDGRIFTITAAQLLDGVIDMPTNVQFARFTNEAGQLSLNLTVPGTWPYGCYQLTGRGLSSGGANTASAFFVVIPGGRPGPNGNVILRATLNGQDTNVIQQGQILEIDGRGFIGGELVSFWLTAPDGTVIDFPPGQQVVQASANGAVSTSFQFEGKNPVGRYTVTALGNTSGFRAFAHVELRSRPVTPRGPARLSVVVPAGATAPQRSIFYANGDLFFPGERVDLWLTMPDGAVRGFPSTFADPVAGQFMVELFLDERLPVGFYQLTAQGAVSQQLVIATFTVTQTTDTIANPQPVPQIGLDNNPTTPPDQSFVDPNPADSNEYGNPDE
ncbi:MAG: hypothetical protein C0184_10380 [Chloroflexus aggregans]|uniref:Uncharacterized protein n=1 Tax=Chloroflexus aggregans TaxID=152260 RepID=A0A2J6X347_9CHLR|nr:MAG: hypothetical protein C0184_10380 [Chloroflexus aggregans]